MNSVEALEWRYATKKFDDKKKLSPEKIELLKKAFRLTPTSFGLQPLRLVIVQNKALQKTLVKHSNYQKQVATASHVLVLCIETTINTEFIINNFEREKTIRNTPDEILRPYRDFLIDDFEKRTPSEINHWAINQVYLAMGSLLNVCATEGIDACPMEGIDTNMYDEILHLKKEGLESVLALPVGYRAEDDIFADFKKVRRPLGEIVIEMNGAK